MYCLAIYLTSSWTGEKYVTKSVTVNWYLGIITICETKTKQKTKQPTAEVPCKIPGKTL